MLEDLLPAFVTLFVIIDPIGLVPIFVALTAGTSAAHKRKMAIMGPLIAGIILVGFGLVGQELLGALGIGMPAFRMAGGLMLFLIGMEMVFERRSSKRQQRADDYHGSHQNEDTQPADQPAARKTDDEPDDISAFPLATPFLAGPGSIATVMLLLSEHEGDLVFQGAILLAVVAVLLISVGLFIASAAVARLLPPLVIVVISRILGMLLAALALQILIDGLKQAFSLG